MSKKLYHLQSHLFITLPDAKTGLCKVGLSQYALKYFLRFNKMDYSGYARTKYGINNSTLIKLFLRQTSQKYENQLLIKQKKKLGETQQVEVSPDKLLSMSQKMQYDRFLIKQGQPFSLLKTYEFDIELSAPVDMRVIEMNYDTYYWDRFLTVPYFFQIQCLNMGQLNDLITEEQYSRAPKFFEYC